jgi:hypothetical protein
MWKSSRNQPVFLQVILKIADYAQEPRQLARLRLRSFQFKVLSKQKPTQKRRPPHILADEHLSEACAAP